MRRPEPVFDEALRGLAGSGTAHTEYLYYLFLQAVVLFVWWPKDSLLEALATADRPATLLASVLALGLATAWYSARAGAEEFLLPGQSGLAEWALGTALAPRRIVAGYLAGTVAQVVGLVALALPLVLCGYAVSGATPAALGGCLLAVIFQATFFRMAAAAIHLAIGQQQTMTRVCVRAAVVAVYATTFAVLPAASHLRVSYTLLDAPSQAAGLAHPAYGFLAGMAAATLVALLLVRQRIVALRRAGEARAR